MEVVFVLILVDECLIEVQIADHILPLGKQPSVLVSWDETTTYAQPRYGQPAHQGTLPLIGVTPSGRDGYQ